MKTYSVDFRERALALVDGGRSLAEVADLLAVGVATLKRWRCRQRATGAVDPRPRPGRPPRIRPEQHTQLVAQVRTTPDATLAEHCDAWAALTGERVSPATMCRALQKAGLPLKKSTSSPPSATRPRARPGGPRRPTGSTPRGERAAGRVPRNHGPNVTLLAALTPQGIGPSVVLEGAADGAVLAAYAEQFLAPGLRPGQVVVLDNLSAHKDARVRAAVEAAGGRLLFLPAYSPDFNPIELAFAKLKAELRRVAARTPEALVPAIGAALAAVTAADARAFFAHCGFSRDEDQLL
jgi:transposase